MSVSCGETLVADIECGTGIFGRGSGTCVEDHWRVHRQLVQELLGISSSGGVLTKHPLGVSGRGLELH